MTRAVVKYDLLEDAVALLGAGLIVFGVGRIYAPAGYVAAGTFCFAGLLLYIRALNVPTRK